MRNRRLAHAAAAALLALAPPRPGAAGGGPRNVLVVVNERSEESLEIGAYYLRRRGIPAANLCRIRTSTALTTDKATYQAEIETPVEQCLSGSPYAARLDYIVLTRGIPILARFPGGDVSTTALLQALATPLRGKDQEYDDPYGFLNYPNPYLKQTEAFTHARPYGGYQLYLGTMLSGYWSEEAKALVDRSIQSDGNPPTAAGGTFYLEEGVFAADPRNADFPAAAANLVSLGTPAVHVRLGDANVTGAVVASHVNSGSYSAIGKGDIDSNTYPPGAIVDVLESFGLTPNNFTPGGADQTPVTWWIAAGATGGHGTVSEPYNVAFPDGFMLEPYVAGFNLAETFYQGIPYLYWMNLVLGDPLAAPYATPPAVTIAEPLAGATVSGTVALRAAATTVKPAGIEKLELFVDDVLAGTVAGAMGQVSWDSTSVPDGWHRLEVVAYEDTLVHSQATAGLDFRVDNLGRNVTITAPAPGTRVAGTFPATVTATGGIDFSIRAEGLDVGSGFAPSPVTIDVDTSGLGRGWHTLVARASAGPGIYGVSAGVDVYVVKPPRFYALAPMSGPTTGGTPVAIDGWNFEPQTRVFFAGTEAAAVTVRDANHLLATTPPGPPGPALVRIENPLGLALDQPQAFTYCPAPSAVLDLRLVRLASGDVEMTWTATADPCWRSYHVFAAADPPAPPPFPAGFTDLTASDQDGNAGGDAMFRGAPPAGQIVLFRVASELADGSIGP